MFEQFNHAIVCHNDSVIGAIQNVNYGFPHFYGKFIPTTGSDEYRKLFAFLMDEDTDGEPPFSEEMLDEENWWIKMPDGERVDILIPAIDYDDGTIDWRMRL